MSEKNSVKLALRVPGFACIYMTSPDDPLWPYAVTPNSPGSDELLHGELLIYVPARGPERCKAIRIIYRSMTRLNMGPSRGWEEDLIFERRCELIGSSSESGIDLAAGINRYVWFSSPQSRSLERTLKHRFNFTMILPAILPPHDWHQNGKLIHELIAEVEGRPVSKSLLTFRDNSQSRSPARSTLSHGVSIGARPESPAPLIIPIPVTLGSTEAAFRRARSPTSSIQSLTTIRQDLPITGTPSQERAKGHRASAAQSWLKGTISASRPVVLFCNPSRANEPTHLDERKSGFATGLGLYEFQLSAEVVSAACSSDAWLIDAVCDRSTSAVRPQIPRCSARSDDRSRPPPLGSDALHSITEGRSGFFDGSANDTEVHVVRDQSSSGCRQISSTFR